MYVRKAKYSNRKTELDGVKFDSAKESRRYAELKLLERAGEISELDLQPKFALEINGRPILLRSKGFPNGRRATCTWDFRYKDKSGQTVIEDVKGGQATRTEAYVLRRGLFEALYPDLKVREV